MGHPGRPLYTGPIARAAGDIDLSLPAGLLVSAAIYLLMMRSRRTRPAGSAPFRP